MTYLNKIAAQLYGLHFENSTELESLIQEFNRLNISRFELFNTHNIPQQSWVKLKNSYCLSIIGVHRELDLLQPHELDEFIHFLKSIECNKIVIPAFIQERVFKYPLSGLRRIPALQKLFTQSLDSIAPYKWRRKSALINEKNYLSPLFWEEVAVLVNNLEKKLAKHQIQLGIHNHSVEFFDLASNQSPWSILNEKLSPNIFFQFDITNAIGAKKDPVQIYNNYKKRIKSIHFKLEPRWPENCYQEILTNLLANQDNLLDFVIEVNWNNGQGFNQIKKTITFLKKFQLNF